LLHASCSEVCSALPHRYREVAAGDVGAMKLEETAMEKLLGRSKTTARELQRCSGRLRAAVCGCCHRHMLR
jgi:hypothetical protein